MKQPFRYQNRFIRKGERTKKGTVYITDPKEIQKWKQYFIDQVYLANHFESNLTIAEKQRILEAVKDYSWTEDRCILIKEPVD